MKTSFKTFFFFKFWFRLAAGTASIYAKNWKNENYEQSIPVRCQHVKEGQNLFLNYVIWNVAMVNRRVRWTRAIFFNSDERPFDTCKCFTHIGDEDKTGGIFSYLRVLTLFPRNLLFSRFLSRPSPLTRTWDLICTFFKILFITKWGRFCFPCKTIA